MIAEIAIAERQFQNEPFQDIGILRDVMVVKLVARVIGENRRNFTSSCHAQGGVAEKKRVMRVDDIRLECIKIRSERQGDGQGHREIASCEALYGGNADNAFLMFGVTPKGGRDNQYAMPLAAEPIGKSAHSASDAADMRREGVGEHDDVHLAHISRMVDRRSNDFGQAVTPAPRGGGLVGLTTVNGAMPELRYLMFAT
jgi:hypothetical protein